MTTQIVKRNHCRDCSVKQRLRDCISCFVEDGISVHVMRDMAYEQKTASRQANFASAR